jgi:hypothetical protein
MTHAIKNYTNDEKTEVFTGVGITDNTHTVFSPQWLLGSDGSRAIGERIIFHTTSIPDEGHDPTQDLPAGHTLVDTTLFNGTIKDKLVEEAYYSVYVIFSTPIDSELNNLANYHYTTTEEKIVTNGNFTDGPEWSADHHEIIFHGGMSFYNGVDQSGGGFQYYQGTLADQVFASDNILAMGVGAYNEELRPSEIVHVITLTGKTLAKLVVQYSEDMRAKVSSPDTACSLPIFIITPAQTSLKAYVPDSFQVSPEKELIMITNITLRHFT